MRTIKKPFAYSLFIFSASLSCMSSFAADTANPPTEMTEADSTEQGLLYQIPRLIDATPTVFPEQSEESTVPTTSETENSTWPDRQQKNIREWADRTAHKIDNWFGDTDPNHPASATLRVILDSTWNKHDGYELSPRIRGKIKLPTLEQKVSVVFGDDSLDNELANNVAITNENPASQNNKNIDNKKTREDNGSIAIRWSEFSKYLPFKTDLDLSEEVYENSEAYGIDLQPYFKYNNDKDIYERVLSLLENDKITYQEWDNFLKKYE